MSYTNGFTSLLDRLKGKSGTSMPSRIQSLNEGTRGASDETLKALKTFTSDVSEKAKRKRDAQEGDPGLSIVSEEEQKPQSEKVNGDPLSLVAKSMGDISGSLKSMSSILQTIAKDMQPDKKAAYDIQEAALENKPGASMTIKRVKGDDAGPGFFSVLKSLMFNPAVIAAVAALVYAFLPDEMKLKINSFFKGFTEGVGEATDEMGNFGTAVKVAGGAIALYLGSKLLSAVTTAITTLVAAIKLMRTGFGKLRKASNFTKFAVASVAGAGAYVLTKELIAGNEQDNDREERAEHEDAATPPPPSPTDQSAPSQPNATAGSGAGGGRGFINPANVTPSEESTPPAAPQMPSRTPGGEGRHKGWQNTEPVKSRSGYHDPVYDAPSGGSGAGGGRGFINPAQGGGNVTEYTPGGVKKRKGEGATKLAKGNNKALKKDIVSGEEPALQEPNFLSTLQGVASRLGISPEDLLSVMKHESGLDPKAVNPYSDATGLIQFMPDTAKGYGTNVQDLYKMSATDQLKFVEMHYKTQKLAGRSRGDLYMATFMPAALNKPDNFVLGEDRENAGSVFGLSKYKIYQQNKINDYNKDGILTVGDVRRSLDYVKLTPQLSAQLTGSSPILASNQTNQALIAAMERARDASRKPAGGTTVISNGGGVVDMGRKKQPDTSSIPSPIASRGSLISGATHYSAA